MSNSPINSPTKNANDTLHADELTIIIDAHLKKYPEVSHHLNSFNNFIDEGLPQIMKNIFLIEGTVIPDNQPNVKSITVSISFTNVSIKPPSYHKPKSGSSEPLYPYTAAVLIKAYLSDIFVDANIKVSIILNENDVETEKIIEKTIRDYIIGSIPVMVGSKVCNTYDVPKDLLFKMKMDPNDIGGYFLVKGRPWSIDNSETNIYNYGRIHNNIGFKTELAREEFLSKPGDSYENSYEIILKLLNNSAITLTISIIQLRNIPIPFYLVFRILGISNDKAIADCIAYGDDSVSNAIKNMIYNAFNSLEVSTKKMWTKALEARSQSEAILLLATNMTDSFGKLLADTTKDNIKIIHNKILNIFDTKFLPHIGTTADSRENKAKFFGYLIFKLLATNLGIFQPIDRDSYKNKRIHPAGEGYAKVFKTFFNYSIAQILKKGFMNAYKTIPYNDVNIESVFKSNIKQSALGAALMSSITTGTKDIVSGSKRLPNKISSQIIQRKNKLNIIACLRSINISNSTMHKGAGRSVEMRDLHPSSIPYICGSQSPDTGEKVGLNRQMGIATIIAMSSSSAVLKEDLMKDSRIIPIELCNAERIYKEDLARIFINGNWIGCAKWTVLLAEDYRNKRRNQEIDRNVTIFWDNITNELYFFCDTGRLMRPALIVHKTYQKDKDGMIIGVDQDIKLTRKHINELLCNKITMDDLINEQIIEYVSPEEQENCLFAYNYEHLKENRNNLLLIYTHCEIPQCLPGFPALTSVRANHNQSPRITFQTNQSKQTNGIPTYDWPYVVEKGFIVTHNNDNPIAETITGNRTNPNGENCILAIAITKGYNQEDSCEENKGSIEMGVGDCTSIIPEYIEIEKHERRGFSPPAETADLKTSYANYSKLVDGIIPIGTVVSKGDVIFAKYALLRNNVDVNSKFKYADTSIIWRHDEDATAVDISPNGNVVNDDGNHFLKIIFRAYRPVTTGEKKSSRAGQKMIVAKLYNTGDMPFTSSGLIPDIIMNPHSHPKRMTPGMIIEMLASKVCAYKGTRCDGTFFNSLDLDLIENELESLGFNRYGIEKLYNGRTGEAIDVQIFMGPCYIQRLQKFVIDTVYANSDSRICPRTKQPMDGRASSGSLRLGEMEKDCYVSHGSMRGLREKFYKDSDGYSNYICSSCGHLAVTDIKNNMFKCNRCDDSSEIVKVKTSWVAKNVIQSINAIGIDVTYEVSKPFER